MTSNRKALRGLALAVALCAAGPATADDTVPCDKDTVARLQHMIKQNRGKISDDVTSKAERQYEIARKALAEGKGRLCSLALKKGFSLFPAGVR